MAALASDVINKARIDLVDVITAPATDGVRWLNADLLGYLNDAQVVVAILKLSASVVTSEVALVAGCRQALPVGALLPIRFGKNVPGGSAPSTVVPDALDKLIPDWQTHAAAAKVAFVAWAPTDPKVFLVYPAQPSLTTQKIEATYSALPAVIATIGNSISLADEYVPALIDYVLYRAWAKDAEAPDAAARSMQALQNFSGKLGVQMAAVRQAAQQGTP